MPATIAILAPSAVPYEVGGAEKFWWGLRNALAARGDAFVELLKVPCREKSFPDLVNTYETFSQLDLSHFDMLITTKYPAWIAPHHNHVCYLQHTLRGLYDTYAWTGLPETLERIPAKLADLMGLVRKQMPQREDLALAFELIRKAMTAKSLPSSLFDFPGPLIREVTHFFDRIALAPDEIRAYLAISQNVARRKDYFPEGVQIKVLPHPSDLAGFHCEKGAYFFTASRLHSNKRVRLIADAMRHVPLDIPLKIAGTGPELKLLKERFAHDSRIEFLGYVSDEDLVDLYAGAIAVPYAPIDEDYGLITIEAMKSGKPVITTPDAGGVCEFVEDGETGYVVDPYPPAMGAALTRLARNLDLARSMGEKAREKVAHINWPENVKSLMDFANAAQARPEVVVCAPFAADEHGAGGPRRLYHFCAKLGEDYSVRLVCYGSQTQSDPETRHIAPGVVQTSLPWPEAILVKASEIAEQTGQSSDDMGIMAHCAEDDLLLARLREEGKDAAFCIAAHPWLYPAIRKALPDVPLAYDAHNVEADMKEAVYGKSSLATECARLEGELCDRAKVIFACSDANAARLALLYGISPEKIAVMPNGCRVSSAGVDRKSLRKRLAFARQPIAIFIGSDHKPNVDAALAIFKLARQLPQVQFLLVGSVCYPPSVARIERPENLHLLGPLTEKVKRTLLERADVALNPVVSGSGVNLKIMEYLASGLPCVSTSFGCRGIPHDFGTALHVVPLEDFAPKIAAVLETPPDADFMESIRQRAVAQFDWNATLDGLSQRLDASINRDSASAPAS